MEKIYRKSVINGYILALGTSMSGNGNITETEFLMLKDMFENKPVAPDGYEYKLKDATLEWELVELPPAPPEPEPEEEPTAEDYEAALERFGV